MTPWTSGRPTAACAARGCKADLPPSTPTTPSATPTEGATVTDLPEPAVEAAAKVALRQYESEYSAAHLSWRDFEGEVRELLEAAAPHLAEHVAAKIHAHRDAHGPTAGAGRLTWRRHLGIAARVAAAAFMTDDDRKREAAQAIARGDYVVCNPTPEGNDHA